KVTLHDPIIFKGKDFFTQNPKNPKAIALPFLRRKSSNLSDRLQIHGEPSLSSKKRIP
ncbi:Chaperone protein dnaK2, partial [Frankliniella fusca]